ncbi:MAG: phosphatidylglycerol lysyltransferase domain-containing protein [bacterium]
MIPEYPKFKSIETRDIEQISQYLNSYSCNVCELNLANLILWKDFDRPETTLINNNPCILINPLNEAPFFLEPLGNNKLTDTIETCLGHTRRLARVSEYFIHKLGQEKYRIICHRSHFDYIYLQKDLAELKGKKYDGKRNHINKFTKMCPDNKFVPIEVKHKKDALELFEKWFEIRKESRFFPKLAYNSQKQAIEKSFKYFEQLALSGGAIICNNKLQGFIIGSRLNAETISVHFAYGHPAVSGITPALFNKAGKTVFGNYKYINLEQDLGIPGLRKSKLSYHPHHLERKFEIRQK